MHTSHAKLSAIEAGGGVGNQVQLLHYLLWDGWSWSTGPGAELRTEASPHPPASFLEEIRYVSGH